MMEVHEIAATNGGQNGFGESSSSSHHDDDGSDVKAVRIPLKRVSVDEGSEQLYKKPKLGIILTIYSI